MPHHFDGGRIRQGLFPATPAITGAPGLVAHAKTMPARASAVVWATDPAMVMGLDAPSCPKTLMCTGRPAYTASIRTSQLSLWKRNGGTAWLTISDRKGALAKSRFGACYLVANIRYLPHMKRVAGAHHYMFRSTHEASQCGVKVQLAWTRDIPRGQ